MSDPKEYIAVSIEFVRAEHNDGFFETTVSSSPMEAAAHTIWRVGYAIKITYNHNVFGDHKIRERIIKFFKELQLNDRMEFTHELAPWSTFIIHASISQVEPIIVNQANNIIPKPSAPALPIEQEDLYQIVIEPSNQLTEPQSLHISLKLPENHNKEITEKATYKCSVCMEKESNVAILPCGHMCGCKGCLKNPAITKCPICRGDKNEILQIFQTGMYEDKM